MKKLLVILALLSFATACQGFGGTWAFGPWTSGESLIDPGTDQSPFWDDSAGRMAWGPVPTPTLPGGSDTEVQYNNSLAFGGDPTFTFDDVTNTLDVNGVTISGTRNIGLDMSSGTFSTAIQKWSAGTIQSTGDIVYQPTSDGTTRYQWDDKDGNNILTIDTVNNAWLPTTTKLGTTLGTTSFVNATTTFSGPPSLVTRVVIVGEGIGTATTGAVFSSNIIGTNLANATTNNIARNNIVGDNIASASLGFVDRNNIVGSSIANITEGTISLNNLVGSNIADEATGAIMWNNIVGISLACKAGSVQRNNIVGSVIIDNATGDISYNNIVGFNIGALATGDITGNYIVGQNLANAFTGRIRYNFISGFECVKDTTTEVNCEQVIAFPYQSLKGSTAADLDNSIAIGFQAGLNNAFNNPALFGHSAVADAHRQIVLGSDYYTGGVRLYGANVEHVSATPYFTLHNSTHEDTDGGRESRLIFKGEQSGGEETELAVIEVSHDGTGDDQLAKLVLSINTGAGVVDVIDIDSSGNTKIGDAGVTNYTQFSIIGDQTFVGTAGFYPRRVSQSAIPAAGTGSTQVDTGEFMVWRDSDDAKIYLLYNDTDSGIKSIEML